MRLKPRLYGMVLFRFSSLLSEDSIGICLDKEDPELTLAVLSLLSHMTRSPALAAMLCTYKEPSCIPFTCYQCLLEPPAAVATESSDTGFKIRIQVGCVCVCMLKFDQNT